VCASDNFGLAQLAYRRHYSTETVLLQTIDSIYRSSKQGRPLLLISLDLNTAFNTIDRSSSPVRQAERELWHFWHCPLMAQILPFKQTSVRPGRPVWISTYSLSHESTAGLSAWPPSVHVLHLTYQLNCFVVRHQHSAVCGWHSNWYRFNNCQCNRTFNSSLLLFVCFTSLVLS